MAGSLSRYPKWIVANIEDHDVLKSACRCGQFNELSAYDKRYFEWISYWIAVQVANTFYLDMPIGNLSLVAWVWSAFNVFYEFFLLCSMFNIIIMIRLSRSDSMSFMLQLFQFVASTLMVIFIPSWTYESMLLFTGLDRDIITVLNTFLENVFTLWCQLLSLSLFLDRLFCVWKPLIYNTQATRKKAIVLSLTLLPISIAIPAINLFAFLTKDANGSLNIFVVGYTLTTVAFLLSLLSQLIVLISFLLLIKNRTDNLPDYYKKRQQNLNRMMIGTGLTEMTLSLCHMLTNFFIAAMCIAVHYNQLELSMSFLNIYFYLLFFSPPFLGIAPFISLLVCLTTSKTYRKSCRSLFRCKPNSVSSTFLFNVGTNSQN